jgi:hypothetical protein
MAVAKEDRAPLKHIPDAFRCSGIVNDRAVMMDTKVALYPNCQTVRPTIPREKVEESATSDSPAATTTSPVDRTFFSPNRWISNPAGIAISMLASPLTPVKRPTCEKLKSQDF